MTDSDGSATQYWFCLKHHTVEGADGCRSADRLGPYASSEEAARALDKVAERNEEWDHDPQWNDEPSSDP
jgi:pterin-4a-carbinolamine dehydratase